MNEPACPSEEELSRALAPGGDARVAAHAAGCPGCRARRDALRAAIARTKDLPFSLPGPARTGEVRARLLERAASEPLGRARLAPRVAGAAAAAGTVVAVVVWLAGTHRTVPAPRSHVVVRAGVGARYELSPPPWETVRLWEGRIDLDVDPLGPGDRVRVQVGDGEVEVRGTRFEVAARDDRLVGVAVTHGRVEVRPAGEGLTVLGAGQAWRAPAGRLDGPSLASRAAPPTTAPPPSLTPPLAPAVPESPRQRLPTWRRTPRPLDMTAARALRPTRQEQLYDDAWDALRAGRFDKAAAGFARVLSESPRGPLGDEAAFWRATSLARGGHPEKALPAFEEYVATYRSSTRHNEAATILGWLLVDAHRPAEAVPLFRGATQDPDASVRKSAREGLAAATPR